VVVVLERLQRVAHVVAEREAEVRRCRDDARNPNDRQDDDQCADELLVRDTGVERRLRDVHVRRRRGIHCDERADLDERSGARVEARLDGARVLACEKRFDVAIVAKRELAQGGLVVEHGVVPASNAPPAG
jgi:hypothetical protein